jgi:hypothetical protein
MITDERERSLGWRVPQRFTGGREVRCSAFMVFPAYLPGGVLRAGWFPLLVHPDTPTIMIVPRRFCHPNWCASGPKNEPTKTMGPYSVSNWNSLALIVAR